MTQGRSSDDAWMRALGGVFIVFDGPDGSGKSTQFTALARRARAAGVGVTEIREPGGTHVGERIREILLDPIHDEMSLRCEMMLYMASRAQVVEEIILPALARGDLVLADRYVSSTFAYQGAAGGLDEKEIEAVASAACRDAWPNLVVIFDVDAQTAAARLGPQPDRMELKGDRYHALVREGFLRQARQNPDGFLVVDAARGAPDVEADVVRGIRSILTGRPGAPEGR